jgi:HEPN domain-containing protein
MRRNSFYAYAQSDLQQMEINKEHGYIPYSNTCVAAQQYVEKMLKDKLQDFEDFPPKTHNIHVLMEALSESGIPIDDDLYDKATVLSSFYLSARYPDVRPADIGEESAESACQFAKQIVNYYESFEPDYDDKRYIRTELPTSERIHDSDFCLVAQSFENQWW